MTKPDLMAELAEVVRLLETKAMLSREGEGAAADFYLIQYEQASAAFIHKRHAELEAVVSKAKRYDWIVERVEADEVDYMLPSVCRIDFKPGAELNGMHDSLDTAIDQAIAKEASHGLEE